MFGKRAVLVGVMTAAVVAGAAAVASATDGSGETKMQIARGQSVLSFGGIPQQEGNDIQTNMNTLAPGGFTGWRSHPGVAVLVIKSGGLEVFSEPIGGGKCSKSTFTAGQAFIERPADRANIVNPDADQKTVFAITFFNVPHDQPMGNRIDQPAPSNCPG